MSSGIPFVPLGEFQRVLALRADPIPRTAAFAALCRINALYMICRAGSGHIGSSFSSLDLVAWLHLNELRLPEDVYFSSKGHDVPGLYSVLLGLGLLEFPKLHALRRLNGLPGHPDVSVPRAVANTGSLGMGISKAKGMALADRLDGKARAYFILTGDGELQEGQFWESLASAVNHRLHNLTAIVDHNKIQSDTWVDKVGSLGDLEAKFRSFGWHAARCDGHDLAAIGRALAALRGVMDRPRILLADTIKGRGVSFMEQMGPADERYRFHSGAPDEETARRAFEELAATAEGALRAIGGGTLRLEQAERPPLPVPARPQRLVDAYSRELIRAAERRADVVALDADLALDTGLMPFARQFPDRFVECGIAEQDMVSQAGGLALRGKLPFVHSFACFLSARPNEQIYNNATERTKVVYVGSLAGLLPGGPGHSHQCVRDISALAAVPGLEMIEPSCEREVALAVERCLAAPSSVYLRLISIPCDVPFELPAGYRLEPGRGVVLREGTDAVVFGYGPVLLAQAWEAALRLEGRVRIRLVNLPWLNRIDPAWLAETVRDVPRIYTLDNHYVDGGQGDMILRTLAQIPGPEPRIARRLGVESIPVCGTNAEVLAAHKLDAGHLAAAFAGDAGPA